jgi:hypothetical protein
MVRVGTHAGHNQSWIRKRITVKRLRVLIATNETSSLKFVSVTIILWY